MTSFFYTWQLWQRMTFVLACAMVFTVNLGLLKLAYNRYKLRHFSFKLEDPESNSPVVNVLTPFNMDIDQQLEHKVPFGIRAIERGIIVEGVWISPTTSPQSSWASSPATLNRGRVRFLHDVSRFSFLEKESTAKIGDDGPFHEAERSRTLPQSHAQTTHRSREIRQDPVFHETFLRNSVLSDELSHQCVSILAIEGRFPEISESAIPKQDVVNSEIPRMQQCGDIASVSTEIPAAGTASVHSAISKPQVPIAVWEADKTGDVGLWEKHRLSQVASMGQLTPRSRPDLQNGGDAELGRSDNYFQAQTHGEFLVKECASSSTSTPTTFEKISDRYIMPTFATTQVHWSRIGASGSSDEEYREVPEREGSASDLYSAFHSMFAIIEAGRIKQTSEIAATEDQLLQPERPRLKKKQGNGNLRHKFEQLLKRVADPRPTSF